MGSESTPPNPSNENPQQQSPEPVKSVSENGTTLREEAKEGISQKSVFVNSEPIREEQVQNAVKFLSHPSVRSSPIIHRRSFLERKGLTKEEIDEAFRRVPDPTPSATTTTTQAANPNQVGQAVAANAHLQVPTQASAAAPTSVVSTVKQRLNWSHVFAGIGLLCCTGAGSALLLKSVIVPKLKNWIRKIVLEEDEEGEHSIKKINSRPSVAEEAAAAAKAAAAAAADVARASQEMLNSKNEERKYFEALMVGLNAQVEEMKLMSGAIQKLKVKGDDDSIPSNKLAEEVKSSSQYERAAPPSTEPSVAPHPKSYMEIMAMVQRGEKPPGIKEINDLPPNPNQPPSKPLAAPRSKPWEVGHSIRRQDASSNIDDGMPASQLNGDNSEPWWRRKNVTITEMEPEDDWMVGPQRAKAVQSSWVPPQPPPISMPEAAAAIRQPKSSVRKEQSVEDQESRVTEISETGVEQEINGVNGHSEVHEIEVQHVEKGVTEGV